MKKYYFLIVLTLILGLILTGCLLSNVGQVPATGQSGVTYLTKNTGPVLAARWDFDTITGGTVADLSDNGNTGTVYIATLVDSQYEFGKALSFSGTNDYVEVGDASELRFGHGDSITIEAWVQPAAATALGVIVQKGGIMDHNTNYVLRQAGKKVDFFYRGIDNIWRGFRTDADVLTPLEWAHVAVTYTFGTPASIEIYVNYISYSVSGQWPGSSDPMQNDQTLRFGGLNYWGQKYYGLLDEVRIWSSALTSSQLNDMTPPSITSTNDGQTYLLNQVVAANGAATDSGTGLASVTTSVTNLDTSTVGNHSFTVTAADYAMNEAIEEVTYYVYPGVDCNLVDIAIGKIPSGDGISPVTDEEVGPGGWRFSSRGESFVTFAYTLNATEDGYNVTAGRSNVAGNAGIINDYPTVLDLSQSPEAGVITFSGKRGEIILTGDTSNDPPLFKLPGEGEGEVRINLHDSDGDGIFEGCAISPLLMNFGFVVAEGGDYVQKEYFKAWAEVNEEGIVTFFEWTEISTFKNTTSSN